MAQDDETGEVVHDMATIIREFAVQATEIDDTWFVSKSSVEELPIIVRLEGAGWASAVFSEDADPYEQGNSASIATAQPDDPGIDIVRFEYSLGKDRVRVFEGASFYLIASQGGLNASAALLKTAGPLKFSPPDGDGWCSTNPDTRLDDCETWDQRIDATRIGMIDAVLVFKIELRSRQFQPNAIWF